MTINDQHPVNEWNVLSAPIGSEADSEWRAIMAAPPSVRNLSLSPEAGGAQTPTPSNSATAIMIVASSILDPQISKSCI